MKCGQCKRELQLTSELQLRSESVTFRTSRGTDVRVHFCSLLCLFWGGAKYTRSLNPGAATTARTFRQLYPGACE